MSFFTNSKILTISLDEDLLKILHIKKGAKSIELLNAEVFDLQDLSFQDLDFSKKAQTEDFVNQVKIFLQKNKISTKVINLVIPEKYVFKYNFEVDAEILEKSVIKSAIEKVAKILNLDEEEFHFDFVNLDKKVQQKNEQKNQNTENSNLNSLQLQTFSVKKSIILNLKMAFKASNLKLEVIDLAEFCIQRWLSASGFFEKTKKQIFIDKLNLAKETNLLNSMNLNIGLALRFENSENLSKKNKSLKTSQIAEIAAIKQLNFVNWRDKGNKKRRNLFKKAVLFSSLFYIFLILAVILPLNFYKNQLSQEDEKLRVFAQNKSEEVKNFLDFIQQNKSSLDFALLFEKSKSINLEFFQILEKIAQKDSSIKLENLIRSKNKLILKGLVKSEDKIQAWIFELQKFKIFSSVRLISLDLSSDNKNSNLKNYLKFELEIELENKKNKI